MIEVTEVKTAVSEEDLLTFYGDYAVTLNAIRKIWGAFLKGLGDKGVEVKKEYLSISPNEVYIRVNDVYMFHREETIATKDV